MPDASNAESPILKLIPGSGLNSEWALSGDYSVDELYVKGTDKQGHSEQPKVRMAPHLWAEVCALVASGKIGYKTPHDLVRDAVYHRLHYWREKMPELDWRDFDVAEALAASERMTAADLERDALLESTRQQLQNALERKAWGRVNQGIEFVEEVAAGVLDEPWHGELRGLAEEYRQRMQSR